MSNTIAIVDDDEGVRVALASLIRSLDYEVRCYSSALDFLSEKHGREPDCLITDIQMPQMSGDELQAQLVAAGRRFPIIFMTAFPSEATRSRVMAAGACCVLDKPVESEAIACWLNSLLRGEHSNS